MGSVKFENYEPKHLSYSAIDGYRSCGMRFFLQKVERVEQVPSLAALGGSAVHGATEKADLGDRRTSEKLFLEAWHEALDEQEKRSPGYRIEDYVVTGKAGKDYGGKKNIDWWLDNGPGMVQSWRDWRDEVRWDIWTLPGEEEGEDLGVEVSLAVDLDGIGMTVMYIDRLMVTRTGQLVVLDLKTGRTPETAEQLGLYALGVEKHYGAAFRPSWGYFWTPGKGHSSPLDLSMYSEDYFASVGRATIAGINAGSFLAKPQNNCRNWCGVARFCPAVGGTLPNKD